MFEGATRPSHETNATEEPAVRLRNRSQRRVDLSRPRELMSSDRGALLYSFMQFTIHTDGGARGNPGPAGVGFVISDGKKVVKEGAAYVGETTNNWAEYEALIRALVDLKKIVPKEKREDAKIEVKMDSELIVRQLNGEYQIKEEPLQLQFVKVWNLRVAEFPNVTFTHVPREENAAADALVNQAIDSHTNNLI